MALRIGGYPEAVQAMSDIITTGCDLELQGAREILKVTTKGQKNYERRLSHDGVYAEGMHYLKADVPNTIMIGDGESDGTKVAVKKNLYFFCKTQEELYAEYTIDFGRDTAIALPAASVMAITITPDN